MDDAEMALQQLATAVNEGRHWLLPTLSADNQFCNTGNHPPDGGDVARGGLETDGTPPGPECAEAAPARPADLTRRRRPLSWSAVVTAGRHPDQGVACFPLPPTTRCSTWTGGGAARSTSPPGRTPATTLPTMAGYTALRPWPAAWPPAAMTPATTLTPRPTRRCGRLTAW